MKKNKIEYIKDILIKNNLTISTIESCTAGAVSSKLASIEGASKYFKGSLVTYMTSVKIEILEVDKDVIDKCDVVSKEVAYQMAFKGQKFFKTDICLSITGYIGEDNNVRYPGTVWICIIYKGLYYFKKYHVSDTRLKNRNKMVNKAINLLIKILEMNG